MSPVGAKFGRDKEPTPTEQPRSATVSNNDVRGTENRRETRPADAGAADWPEMITGSNSNIDLDSVEKSVVGSKVLPTDRKDYLLGKIKERRKAIK